VVEQTGSHSEKLNGLAVEIAREANDDDLLMFLDGDAFPIADPYPLIERGLASAPLLAVRRYENAGDLQPHPCFCTTTVAFWRDLPGDWSRDELPSFFPGLSRRGDVGTMLLNQLECTGTPWVKVRRTNRRNLHPVFFGIYGDVIYNQARASPQPFSRADRDALDSDEDTREELVARTEEKGRELFQRIERDDADWLSELMY
jgi:hypothetical protein